MWDGDKVRYESLEAYKFFSEAKSHLRNVIKEAFSDYYNFNHFDNDNLPDDEDYEMVHEAIDFNTFVDICHSHGWDYHNTMDVTNKNGANGVRYIFSSSCNNNFPFEELVNELKSKATDPDGVIPSMGTNRNAPNEKLFDYCFGFTFKQQHTK